MNSYLSFLGDVNSPTGTRYSRQQKSNVRFGHLTTGSGVIFPGSHPYSNSVIDLRSVGGDKAGEIMVAGTPEVDMEHTSSHAGRDLRQVLEQHPPEIVAV